MLQTSTTDSEFYLLPVKEKDLTPITALSADNEIFYNSIKEELSKLSCNPPQQAVDNILNYSKSL
jgi:hypothetical protein